MVQNYLIKNKAGEEIYKRIKSLPIYDYHCHLSPKEIYEDKEFADISEMWLGGDHYKWRLMRTAGIDEHYITGDASPEEKFVKYASAIEYAAGNPLYHWSHMELSMFFGIDDALTSENALSIYERANKYIRDNHLSPRKLIEQSNVEIICTTDDVTDSLEYHEKIKNDSSFKTKVLPSFRTDNLLLVNKNGYLDYIKKLSEASETSVSDLSSLRSAVEKRLKFFCEMGCRFTDLGIPLFPNRIADEKEANESFLKLLSGGKLNDAEYNGFVGYMYILLNGLYKKYDLVSQWHLAVYRNANSILFEKLGPDCGVDCVGNQVNGDDLIMLLDAINRSSGLPQVIIYTLNSENAGQIASVAGAFPNVRCGTAWWFCDHKRGIREEIEIISENSSLGSFLGMLTDSRSFLSYARHDYFRRILSDILGEWVSGNEFDEGASYRLAERIAYKNIKELVEK